MAQTVVMTALGWGPCRHPPQRRLRKFFRGGRRRSALGRQFILEPLADPDRASRMLRVIAHQAAISSPPLERIHLYADRSTAMRVPVLVVVAEAQCVARGAVVAPTLIPGFGEAGNDARRRRSRSREPDCAFCQQAGTPQQ